MQVNILEAKNRLSALISAVEQDEEVIIARNGVPVAKIVKYTASKIAAPGIWKNQASYNPDWNSEVTNRAVAQLFTGIDDAPVA